jgi:hypothetical protein
MLIMIMGIYMPCYEFPEHAQMSNTQKRAYFMHLQTALASNLLK